MDPFSQLECPPIAVELFATGFTGALRRHPRTELVTLDASVAAPKVVSIRTVPPPIATHSYTFGRTDDASRALEGDEVRPPVRSPSQKQPPASEKRRSDKPKPSGTRVKPPSDTVRLADRLFYLLQPPLETWLNSESLEFAFEPFPYQMSGVAFLYPRHAAILADEMGLGKTMQAITSIRLLLRTGEINNVLLICPKPLVTNWQREFALWAPEIPVAIIEGAQHQRAWQWDLDQVPVKIANYEVVLRDRDRLVDGAREFDLLVLDEAQRIKNRSSTTSQTIRSIERKRSWALTGTPIENSADDLYGIFEFVSPGHLNVAMTPRRMGKAASDFILRRTKDLVLEDLPPKMYRDPQLDLSPTQQITYAMAEDKGIVRLTEMGEGATIQHVFELVLRLKQICNFDPATGDSAKLERLSADLEEVAASQKKAIVFSQWVNTIEKLAERLGRFHPLQYHGKTPSKKRDAVLARFKEDTDSSVLLMSYGAGSVGLNLQFCEYVFLFDRWWNPAVEDQAINRAHRIGAAGPVTVTRFVTAGTIEERIHQVLEDKRALSDAILSEANGAAAKSKLSRSDIFGLFDLKVPGKLAA